MSVVGEELEGGGFERGLGEFGRDGGFEMDVGALEFGEWGNLGCLKSEARKGLTGGTSGCRQRSWRWLKIGTRRCEARRF